VAELGVIGRAEHMQAIMDAERDATLGYLDRLTVHQGGRRGDAATPTRTEGLIYAVTRHATSRAGDPNPHDHVLVANLIRMADAAGGWKAAHTALWRQHLHAATMFGRMAAAAEAVRLGYGITRDDGPSGRLGHWGIAGIPEVVMALHSKRRAEITAEAERLGQHSSRARAIIARDTRARKRHEPVGELMARWRAEIESLGWSVADIERSLAEHRPTRRWPGVVAADEREVVATALAPDGPLARKVFARRDVVVAVAPGLFGLDPAELPRVVNRVLADPEAIPLIRTAGAWGPVWATATTIATEEAIAASVEHQIHRDDAPVVDEIAARRAIGTQEAELGSPLTLVQRSAVMAITTSGRGADLVVGVAGSGKTTALAAVRRAFESEGYAVIGTSTSGQAARTLRNAAGIDESRTLASLGWRLDHGRLTLTNRHAVILDEAAMTDDAAMLGLLEAAAEAGAKVVMVGDHHQLGAVRPGGGFEALVTRYGAAVHVLDENVRQHDVAERVALEHLPAGNVAKAVAFYAGDGRIVATTHRGAALEATVAGWATDAAQGRRAAMYAWRRADEADLNRLGREMWRDQGRLGEDELVAPGGTRYAVGDRVVTLAPAAYGKVVTSETGTVLAIDAEATSLSVRMDDGNAVRVLERHEIGAERLAHAYAVTVHRSQGSTVERAHALEDGGGRELAYVKMSRATQRSTVYVVADSVAQAADDLCREWNVERRLTWAIDAGTPARARSRGRAQAPQRNTVDEALRRGRLLAERHAITAAMPADRGSHIRAVARDVDRLRRRREDLAVGGGTYADHPIGTAMAERDQATENVRRLEANVADRSLPRRPRRRYGVELEDWRTRLSASTGEVADLAGPELARIDRAEATLTARLHGLYEDQSERNRWCEQSPGGHPTRRASECRHHPHRRVARPAAGQGAVGRRPAWGTVVVETRAGPGSSRRPRALSGRARRRGPV